MLSSHPRIHQSIYNFNSRLRIATSIIGPVKFAFLTNSLSLAGDSTSEESARRRNNEGNRSHRSRNENYHRFIPEPFSRPEEAKLGETGETVVIPLGMQIRHVPLSLLARSLVLNIRFFNTFLSLIKLVSLYTCQHVFSCLLGMVPCRD